jgi:hypothetical protein
LCLRSFDSTHRDPGPRARVAVHLVCNETRAGSSPVGSTMRAWRNRKDAPSSEPGGLTPVRVRLSPPAPGASSSVVERWTLNPCRRGFEPLGAHSPEIIRSQHLVVAQFGQSTRFGTGGSAVRVRSTRPAVMQHRIFREWSSGMDARLWTERRWFESIFPSTGEARSMPHRAAVAQSGERRPVKAEATGSKPVCGAKPWW